MVTTNKNLMAQAREALSGRWGLAVGTFFVYMLIAGIVSGVCSPYGSVVVLLAVGAFALGIATFSLALARKQDAKFEMIFSGFSNFLKALGLYLLIFLFTILWTLLLIIPGIIAAFSYSQAFYIMADDPSVGAMEAIDRSKKMMDGYKWKYFCLNLRFIGWALLCILTLGIGFLWLIPYMQVSYAKFYDDVKANAAQ